MSRSTAGAMTARSAGLSCDRCALRSQLRRPVTWCRRSDRRCQKTEGDPPRTFSHPSKTAASGGTAQGQPARSPAHAARAGRGARSWAAGARLLGGSLACAQPCWRSASRAPRRRCTARCCLGFAACCRTPFASRWRMATTALAAQAGRQIPAGPQQRLARRPTTAPSSASTAPAAPSPRCAYARTRRKARVTLFVRGADCCAAHAPPTRCVTVRLRVSGCRALFRRLLERSRRSRHCTWPASRLPPALPSRAWAAPPGRPCGSSAPHRTGRHCPRHGRPVPGAKRPRRRAALPLPHKRAPPRGSRWAAWPRSRRPHEL